MAGTTRMTGRFGPRGRAFHAAILAGFDLSGAELELLAEVCRSLDEIDALNAAVLRDGVTVEGSTGQTRVHPALGEVRQHRLALARLLGLLALPDEQGVTVTAGVSARAKAAAQARWSRDPGRQSALVDPYTQDGA
jgi:hypothetical protein